MKAYLLYNQNYYESDDDLALFTTFARAENEMEEIEKDEGDYTMKTYGVSSSYLKNLRIREFELEGDKEELM